MTSTAPYDWVDLNNFDELILSFGEEHANSLLESGFAESVSAQTQTQTYVNQYSSPPLFLTDNLKHAPSFPARPLFSTKPDLKLDAFHQTICVEEVNEKEKAVAEELYMIEAEWNQLLKDYPDNLNCMMTPSGMFLRVSENSKDIVGQRSEQLIGTNITNFIHINELSTFYDQLNLVVNANRKVNVTHQFKSSSGYIPIDSLYFSCSNRTTEPKCIFCTCSRSKALSEPNSPTSVSGSATVRKFISRLSLDGVYIYSSPQIKDILGFSPNDLVGKTLYELYHEGDFQKVSEANQKIRKDPNDNVTIQSRMRKRDGSFCDVEVVFSVFKNPVSGLLECLICSCTDISKEEENPALIEKLKNEVSYLKQLLSAKTQEVEKLKLEKQALLESRDEDDTRKRRKRKTRTDLQCEECGTKESPEWRKGPSGNQSLCNACGLRYAKKMRIKRGESMAPEQIPEPSKNEETAKYANQLKHLQKLQEFHELQTKQLEKLEMLEKAVSHKIIKEEPNKNSTN